MSFGFGGGSTIFPSTSTNLGFGTTATTKPTGFGTSFFGAPAASTPLSFGLGTAATTSSGFGVPASGFSFNGPPAATTTTATTGFGGFGTFGAATSTPSSGFGSFGSFGTTAAPAANTGQGLFSGFGSTAAPAAGTGTGLFSGFGTTPAAGTSTGLFSGFGSTTNPAPGTSTGLFSGFGQTSTAGTSGFGGFNSFGTKPTTFTWGNQGTSTLGQPQLSLGGTLGTAPFGAAAPQPQGPVDPHQALYSSVFSCQVFGDERDRTLGRWNLIQALWGVGKGYYHPQAPPVEYDMKNPLCRFKAISYSVRPKMENKDGLVALLFNKKDSEIRAVESQLVSSLSNTLGNKPNLSPIVESIRPFSDSRCLVLVFVEEKGVSGGARKIPAAELAAYLTQPVQKQQLVGLGVENVYPHVDPGQEQLREYLDNPPSGIDSRLWKEAQDENPNPEKLIPVPLIGFAEVRWRMKCQEQETALHQAFLDKMADDIADLQRKHTATVAKIQEYKRRYSELQHRVLKVLIVQEISRKMGLSLLPEEEHLKSRMDAVSAIVNSQPFKSRLAELTEGVKSHFENNREPQRYRMDAGVMAEIKQFLTMEQSGVSHVMDTIQSDLSDLKVIKDGMMRILQGHV